MNEPALPGNVKSCPNEAARFRRVRGEAVLMAVHDLRNILLAEDLGREALPVSFSAGLGRGAVSTARLPLAQEPGSAREPDRGRAWKPARLAMTAACAAFLAAVLAIRASGHALGHGQAVALRVADEAREVGASLEPKNPAPGQTIPADPRSGSAVRLASLIRESGVDPASVQLAIDTWVVIEGQGAADGVFCAFSEAHIPAIARIELDARGNCRLRIKDFWHYFPSPKRAYSIREVLELGSSGDLGPLREAALGIRLYERVHPGILRRLEKSPVQINFGLVFGGTYWTKIKMIVVTPSLPEQESVPNPYIARLGLSLEALVMLAELAHAIDDELAPDKPGRASLKSEGDMSFLVNARLHQLRTALHVGWSPTRKELFKHRDHGHLLGVQGHAEPVELLMEGMIWYVAGERSREELERRDPVLFDYVQDMLLEYAGVHWRDRPARAHPGKPVSPESIDDRLQGMRAAFDGVR